MDLREQERVGKEASNRVVCGSKEVSVYEMLKKQENMKIQGKCDGPKIVARRLQTQAGKMEANHI